MLKRYVHLIALVFLLSASSQVYAQSIDFSRYHRQDEINGYMKDVATLQSDIASFHNLGSSRLGREISYLVFSVGNATGKPAMYINGTHHGDEKSSTEAALGMIDYVVRNRNQPKMIQLLEKYTIVVQPLVNPDGHANHTRSDSLGFDLNRDYAYPSQDEQRSFRRIETQLVKTLFDQFNFRAAIAYHSGTEAVLWPWCYSGEANPEHDLFNNLSRIAATAMGMDTYTQSFYDYPTQGEFLDFAYMKQRTLAVTFEVSHAKTPPPARLADIVRRSVDGTLAYLNEVYNVDVEGTRPTGADLAQQAVGS